MTRQPRPDRTGRALNAVQLAAAATLVLGLAGFATGVGAGATSSTTSTSSSTTSTTSTPTTSTTAQATNPNTYDLSAQANALDVLLAIPNLPLGLSIEAGPYGSSASLNSLGQSLSDAGAPYAPTIASLPGTVNGLGSGVLPPLPPLPGYVSASYPRTPTDAQTQGGYEITSTASPSDAKGAVAIGVQPAGSTNATLSSSSEASANGDGSVSVSGSAGIDALSFGQLFDIANVSSSLSMTQQANGQPKVTAETKLGTITLLGQATGLLGKGVSVLGAGVPLDVSNEIIGPLNTVLSKSGVQLTYLPETFLYTDGTKSTGASPDSSKTLQAVDSGALKVTVLQNVPGQGTYGASFTLGRVYLSTSDTPGIVPTIGNTGNTGSAGNTGAGTPAVSTGPGSGSPLGNTGAGTVSVPSGAPGGGGAAPTAPTQALAVEPTYALEKGPSAASLYLLLILVALAVLIASQAVRVFSVRLALGGQRPVS